MSLLSIEELKTLVEQQQELCVSIYLPTVQAGPETRQNSVRFKNMMRKAEEMLVENGASDREAQNLLEPVQAELDREEFWQHQDKGLAIFISSGGFRHYPLPIDFDELVVVTNHFHFKPLLPLLSGDGVFYLLTLSQQEIKFFRGTRYNIQEIELDEDVPQSLEDTLQYDETAKEGQFRISTNKGGTNNSFQRAGVSHGQGSPDRDKHQEDILQFFHAVDRGLQKYLHDQRAPLVLAGVEYLLPLYREANSYQFVLEEGLTGNQKISEPEELHAEAWQIVEPIFMQAQQSAIDHYNELTPTGRASNDLQEAVPAAFYGRVEQLFVAVGVQQWGHFNPETNAIELHSEAKPGDEDLLDAAAIQTILNGGTVYAVEPEAVPDRAPLAAVFRY